MSAPTEPGWYWVRGEMRGWANPVIQQRWTIVRVDEVKGRLYVVSPANCFEIEPMPESMGALEWGPRIPEPTEDGGLRLHADTVIHSNGHRLVEKLWRPGVTRRVQGGGGGDGLHPGGLMVTHRKVEDGLALTKDHAITAWLHAVADRAGLESVAVGLYRVEFDQMRLGGWFLEVREYESQDETKVQRVRDAVAQLPAPPIAVQGVGRWGEFVDHD